MDKVNLYITRKVLFEKYSLKEDMNGFFLSFLDGCEIKLSKSYPYSIFYVKNDKVLFRQELKNKYFYVRYDLMWSVFRLNYQMKYQQIQVFIKGLLETHLKLEGYTPPAGDRINLSELETHLKLEGYTPYSLWKTTPVMLETHLKLEGYTHSC